MEPLTLHSHPTSGNCYKVRLTASLIGVPMTLKQTGIMDGTTKSEAFKSTINPNGKVPVLQIGAHTLLSESHAIMYYLADMSKSDLIPRNTLEHAQMLQWMSFEQFTLNPNVARRRFLLVYIGEAKLDDQQRATLPVLMEGGEKALGLMDEHLKNAPFLVAGRLTLADVALYAYTHMADVGGFDLGKFPHVQAWLARVKALPNYIPLIAEGEEFRRI